ncbi:uncharacterized protein LOC127249036 [Andrographis paniculata]|uniref:uncharacterized protein LOC127249036 n=1 Tax=Andrographis paniculata TaxID=175694 RepID=UPI0021E84D5C|nr:uncharacterized protein LOC127249036 [Andrographis paniculata]
MAEETVPGFHHVARETLDVKRLAQFYAEIFGFEQIESPKFPCEVIWMKLGSFYLHLIEKDPESKLPESPWNATAAVTNPKHLPRGHHLCLYMPNFESFVQSLKEKGIEIHEKTLHDGKTKQVFFFDPDGNGLEVSSRLHCCY